MIYFPRPYPDEVVGSLILRACRHLGLAYKRIIQSIGSGPGAYGSFLLPSNLPRLGGLTGISPERLLWEHTMFPYIVAFMAPAEIARLQRKILGSGKGGESLSSLAKSVTHGTPHRRFCIECVKENFDSKGETYWYRSHLLPGSHLCIRHQSFLLETAIPLAGKGSRDTSMPHDIAGRMYMTHLSQKVLRTLTELSQTALSCGARPTMNYRLEALQNGYRMPSGEVASRQLTDSLYRFYQDEFLLETGCWFGARQRNPWPALLTRSDVAGPYAPPKHLLLATFLKCGATEAKEREYGRPGPKSRNYETEDRKCVMAIRAVLNETARIGSRTTVRNLLAETGFWSHFRHHRHEYPLTAAFLKAFRYSDLSERQLGRRPYWRRRLGIDRE